ncbi:MAG: hypothetical protein CSA11_04660 [Chloroflexi bacterium]|nr:MAG: hypothetical protein CSB13_11065 [Chloroflexota bacterium]PIE81288.1 MAG: hypothetical protein CSA11_04660 [Chloroflexota bacterium]
MVRKRVTLFVIDTVNDQILMMCYNKEGEVYYIVPGGGVEDGETVIEAAYREADEETGLAIELGAFLWERPFSIPNWDGATLEQIEYAYLITQFSGTPYLKDPEFHDPSKDNVYRLEWMPMAEFPHGIVYPPGIDKEKLLAAIDEQ